MHSIRVSPRPWSCRVIRDPQLHSEWAHLPVELYGRIVDFVAPEGREGHNTLAMLSRVSKSMQVVAERALYHTVSLHPIKTRSLCRTILSHRRLWCLVKKCEVFLMLGMTEYRLPDEDFYIRLSQNLLASVLQFERLRDLEVQRLPGSTNFKTGTALCSGIFHLKTFRCSDPFDPDLQAFFAIHPTIEELYVIANRINGGRSLKQKSDLHCPTSKPNPEALPGLATLHAPTARAAELLVGSRAVSRLDISRWDESCCLSKLTNRLARSTGPLRSLLVRSGFELDANDVKTLVTRLPELRFLGECIFVDKVGPSVFSCFVQSDLTVFSGFFPWLCVIYQQFENILQEFAGFQQLRTLVVNHRSFMAYNAWVDAAATLVTQKNMECHMVRALSAVCPSLTRVLFNFPTVRCWGRRGRHWAATDDWTEEACEELWWSA